MTFHIPLSWICAVALAVALFLLLLWASSRNHRGHTFVYKERMQIEEGFEEEKPK